MILKEELKERRDKLRLVPSKMKRKSRDRCAKPAI